MAPRTRALAALCALAAARAAGASDDPTRRGFDADPVRPALSLDGGFAVETAAAARPGALGAAVVLDYSEGLLALTLGGTREPLLESRLTAHLLAGWSLGWLELGAHLPVVVVQHADFSLLERQGVTGPLVRDVASTALGDLRLGAKLPLLDAARFPVGLAALLDLRLPTGNPDAFASDGLSLVPGAIATRSLGPVRLDAQLGYALRRAGQYAQLVVHDGLVYAAGASLERPSGLSAGPLRVERWRAIAELAGGWPRGNDLDTERYRAPLSARAGLRACLGGGLAAEIGGGAGLGPAGYGREAWRVFVGLRWEQLPAPKGVPGDRDGDGVPDAQDRCPDQPGAADMDGCPDRDGDQIPDPEDRCPDEPGPAENEGCPVGDEPLVEIETERLSLKDAIHFDTGKDTIKPESSKVLDAIATVLKEHTELGKVRVEGHTDNVGSAAYNKDLSQRRAQSVVRALVARAVPKDHLVAQGFGFERPIASNATALGRAKNRRVEFTILHEK